MNEETVTPMETPGTEAGMEFREPEESLAAQEVRREILERAEPVPEYLHQELFVDKRGRETGPSVVVESMSAPEAFPGLNGGRNDAEIREHVEQAVKKIDASPEKAAASYRLFVERCRGPLEPHATNGEHEKQR